MKSLRKMTKLKSTWYIWIFPAFAVALCAWLLVQDVLQQGPKIKIYFEDGSRLQPEKTRVRYRGVTIGMVKKVEISEDGKKVVASADLVRSAEHFAVEGSRFWIVSPKVSFQGVSGLETLIEGNYIAAQPGKPDAPEKLEFDGKTEGESEAASEAVTYILEARNIESINVGDFVTFRGLRIGTVSRVNLSKTSQTVVVQIGVERRFTKVIRTNTVFWRKRAVDANLGFLKAELKISSFETMLRGGVDLFTPDPPGEMAKAWERFSLQDEAPKGWEKWNPKLEFP